MGSEIVKGLKILSRNNLVYGMTKKVERLSVNTYNLYYLIMYDYLE